MMISIAGAILISNTGNLLLQRRDNNPSIFSPNMISVFGGSAEQGEDDLLDVAMREIKEETGISLPAEAYLPLVQFKNSYPDGRVINAAFYILENIEKSKLAITEGSLIEIPIDNVGKYMHEMVPTTCFAVSVYLQNVQSEK